MLISDNLYKSSCFLSPKDVGDFVRKILKLGCKTDFEKEHFLAIGLDSRNNVKYVEVVSIGTLNASLVHPREVFRFGITQNIISLVIAHNHPSNKDEPSEADIEITKRLVKAGEILGIEVIDHVIVANTIESQFSFKEKMLI